MRCFSTSATFAPSPAAPAAGTSPAVPAPITTRWYLAAGVGLIQSGGRAFFRSVRLCSSSGRRSIFSIFILRPIRRPRSATGFAVGSGQTTRALDLAVRRRNREKGVVRRRGEFGGGVGADFDRLVSWKKVPFLVRHGLERAVINRLLTDKDAPFRFFEFLPAHGDGIDGMTFHILPEKLLGDGDAVESGLLEIGEKLLLGQSLADAFAHQPVVH